MFMRSVDELISMMNVTSIYLDVETKGLGSDRGHSTDCSSHCNCFGDCCAD